MLSSVLSKGHIFWTIDYLDGNQVQGNFCNNVVRAGKVALAKSLARQDISPFEFYVDQMLFGINGAVSDVPKVVEETRTGLFGSTLLSKNVIASIDSAAPASVIFTSVVAFDEGNGSTLSEMALQLKNEDIYSMATFPGIAKTSNMQLTFDWVVSML